MGRAFGRESSLFILTNLAMMNARTFGFALERLVVDGQPVITAKPIDIFNGINAYQKREIRPISPDDAFPIAPYGMYMFLRLLPDMCKLNAMVNWNQLREVSLALYKRTLYQWAKSFDPQNLKESGLASEIRKDLNHEGNNALKVALNQNPGLAWILLTGSPQKEFGASGLGLVFFFPNLLRLRRSSKLWSLIGNQLNIYDESSLESGLAYTLRVVTDTLKEAVESTGYSREERKLIEELANLNAPELENWLTRTAFAPE